MLRPLVNLLQFLLLLAYGSLALAQENAVGEVVFVSGEVQLQAGAGIHSVKTGEVVQQGQELTTKANGYVYIKTRDNGFISLRPNSAVRFEVYQYVADKPQETRIKTTLKYGVMRSVSGIGAQSARDKYRLNTPVAAIGIRGTDFTVYASADVTRAAVTSGGIVMSGFNDNCTPGGSGPCNGDQIAELFARQAGMLLQIKRGEARPELLDRPSLNMQPDGMSPPLPNETPGKKEAAAAKNNTVDLAGEQAILVKQGTALQETLSQVRAPEPPSLPPAPTQPPSPPPPPPPPPPPAQQVFWGRWLPLAGETGDTPLQTLLNSGKQLVWLNNAFGLVRDRQTDMAMPSSGVYSFALQTHESYILDETSRRTTVAQIENPSLTIDFNRQRFDTRFQVSTDAHRVNVASTGSVGGDGSLVSGQIGSTATVRGSLANGGQQAGFLYQQRVTDRELAVGATYWTR